MSTKKSDFKNKVSHFNFAGFDFTCGPEGTKLLRDKIDTSKPGDYGADPLGDGTFRMVPSGDVVDFEERNRRLKK